MLRQGPVFPEVEQTSGNFPVETMRAKSVCHAELFRVGHCDIDFGGDLDSLALLGGSLPDERRTY